MSHFRVTDQEWSNPVDQLSGEGASQTPGRWNTKGIRTIYTGQKIEVAVAEKAFYAMRQSIEEYNEQASTRKGFPAYYAERVRDRLFKLATIKFSSVLTVVDLTSPGELARQLSDAGLGRFSVSDARKSPYLWLPERWTQRLGAKLAGEKVQALRVPSARSDVDSGFVVYSENLKPHDAEVVAVEDIFLSAVDASHKKHAGNHQADLTAIHFERKGIAAITSVLNIPI